MPTVRLLWEALGLACTSVVWQITLLCGWEPLLKPVVASGSRHCFFCLIEVLIWPSGNMHVSVPVPDFHGEVKFNGLCCLGSIWTVYLISRCTTKPQRECNKSRWVEGNVTFDPSLTGSRAGSFTGESNVVGLCDAGPYSQASKPGGEMFGSASKSLLSCLSVLESTTTP